MRTYAVVLTCVFSAFASVSAKAWIFPEHRDISVQAVSELTIAQKQSLERLWGLARIEHEERFCAAPAERESSASECIDWAALSAIAGDHSCSSAQLLETVSESDWIMSVTELAQELKEDLAEIPVLVPSNQLRLGSEMMSDAGEILAIRANRAERANALRRADSLMQRADAQYATRAASNNAHFLRARADPHWSSVDYVRATLEAGSGVNAIGVYAWFHLSALQKASRLASETLSSAERQALSRAMLFDEAFGLHFLEDAFAAGHVAGTWGNASERKGTHDYYNQYGLETFTWEGRAISIVLMGDAHMRPEDLENAANVVAISLGQVIDAATGHSELVLPHRSAAPAEPDPWNVCTSNVIPDRDAGLEPKGEYRVAFEQTLAPTPIPGLGSGLGALPRFRSELGAFIGLAAALDGRWINNGFESTQNTSGFIAGADVSVRLGVGLEGALGDSSDGLAFVSLGFRGDSSSSNRFSDQDFGALDGNLSAAIPARSALSLRLRAPFYLVPGDLLLLSPGYLLDPEGYTRMAVTAVNGGLIPWQQGFATPFGRFQFVFGRELGVSFYGLKGDDQLLAPGVEPGASARVVNFKSTAFEMPIFEFRLYRSFSSNQSSALLFQFFGGVDIPYDDSIDVPVGAPDVDLQNVWYVGVRMMFDWRYYF